MVEFVEPSFLEDQDIDTIHERMLDNMPDDIDKSEGSVVWDNTYPTASELSYFAGYILTEAIKMIFPMFCDGYDEIMDYHAAARNITRKEAEHATGELTITGATNTFIPEGTEFSTMSVDDEDNIVFVTTEDATITDTSVVVPIRAEEAGISGNVAIGTITLKKNDIKGITGCINNEPTTGGTEEEDTESLQSRIVEYDQSQGNSFIGNVSDYKRWALEVAGTGNAVVIPAQDDSGIVTIVLTDLNGDAASEDLCESVYNHIMSPDDPEKKLAPCIGARLSVVPPTAVTITISAIIELDGTAALEDIESDYLEAIKNYLSNEAADAAEVKYTKIGSILSNIKGVNDYKTLTLNGGTSNVAIMSSQLASCENVNLTTGEV